MEETTELFRKALMEAHADDWTMEVISEAAHICAQALEDEAALADIEESLHSGVSEGLMEVAEEGDGHETKYKLTDYGIAEAMQTIATKGLPLLVAVSSKKAIEDGKDRTVKSMSDEIIAKFPAKLKRLTKETFAPFWNEYASFTPQQYLDAYDDAQQG